MNKRLNCLCWYTKGLGKIDFLFKTTIRKLCKWSESSLVLSSLCALNWKLSDRHDSRGRTWREHKAKRLFKFRVAHLQKRCKQVHNSHSRSGINKWFGRPLYSSSIKWLGKLFTSKRKSTLAMHKSLEKGYKLWRVRVIKLLAGLKHLKPMVNAG